MIDFQHDESTGVARLTLARPDAGNTLDRDTVRALLRGVERAADAGARVLLLDARGKLFCGGGDVAAMSTAEDPAGYTFELASLLHESLLRIAESDMLFVCAVQGAAAGAGFSIILNADYVVASDRASFVTAYLVLGVTPDGGGTYLLPRVIGKTRASEMMLAGRKVDAATAKAWGLVNEVVVPDELEARALEISRSLAAAPSQAASETKRLLSSEWLDGYRAHLAEEADSIARLIMSTESRERQSIFLSR